MAAPIEVLDKRARVFGTEVPLNVISWLVGGLHVRRWVPYQKVNIFLGNVFLSLKNSEKYSHVVNGNAYIYEILKLKYVCLWPI
jgi:hypothetical protein